MNTLFLRCFTHLPQRIRVWMIERGWLNENEERNSPFIHFNENSLPVHNPKSWEKRLRKLLTFKPSLRLMVGAFCGEDLRVIKAISIPSDAPIVLCLQKNDSVRIKEFVEYHRTIGFRFFAFIDNGSTDDSLEWLLSQCDVFLFQTETPYSSSNRDAWINRVMAYFGDNRWYAVLDSDEFLSYEDMENKDVNRLISQLKQEGITRARAMMLDMYAEDGYFENGEKSDFLKECVYFDKDTYSSGPWDYHFALTGGPRKRLFHTDATLTKYPLFFLEEGEALYQAHAMFPLWKNLNTPCHLVIRHYKFLPGDKVKFEKIAQEGTYYGGSIEYKNYVSKMTDSQVLQFRFNGSVKYEDSSSLKVLPYYDAIVW